MVSTEPFDYNLTDRLIIRFYQWIRCQRGTAAAVQHQRS